MNGRSRRNKKAGIEKTRKNKAVIINVNLIFPKFTCSSSPFMKGRIRIKIRKPPRYPKEKPNPEIIPVLFFEESCGKNEL